MSARARHLSVVLAVLLAIATPLAVAAASTPSPSPSTYRVKSGDTITSIAVQLRLPGGWEQLYKANQGRIGTDPNRLTVGTDLDVPQGAAVPAGEGYVVRPGDTLNSIADRLHVTGGGNALYAANRNAIGPDPNRLEVGQTLLPPGAGPRTTAAQPPKASVPPAALNHPAAPAPIAAGSSTQASNSGNNTAVLWSVLAGLLFVLFVVLVLFALPRWRRGSSQEVWVGGSYNADNQPTAAKSDRPQPTTAPEPTVEPQPAVRPEPVDQSAADEYDEPPAVRLIEPDAEPFAEPQPVQLTEMEPFHEPKPFQLTDDEPGSQRAPESVLDEPTPAPAVGPEPLTEPEPEPAAVSRYEPAPEPAAAPPAPASPVAPSDDVRSVVAGLRPGSVERRPHPRRQLARSLLSATVGGLRNDRPRPSGPGRDLTDELLGEVRLVDPSTPLTKDRS